MSAAAFVFVSVRFAQVEEKEAEMSLLQVLVTLVIAMFLMTSSGLSSVGGDSPRESLQILY